jgi:hypothetical protein
MSRIHIGETFTLITTVTDRSTGNLADADDITLRYIPGGKYGTEVTATPTRNSTGNYSAEITPTLAGHLYYRWDTDGDYDVATEGIVNVAQSVFTV